MNRQSMTLSGASEKRTTRKLYSMQEVSRMLGLSVRSIYRLVDRGELPPPVKVGGSSRFFASDLDAYYEKLREQRN